MPQHTFTQLNTAARQEEKRVVVIDPFQRQQEEQTLVAVYARVSTDSEDQEHSLSAQTSHYRRLIKSHENWRLVDIYSDEGISGTSTAKREEFNRLMRDCRRQRVNRVLVKSVSRFCRNTTDSIEAVRELTRLGVSVFFEKEGIDTATMPSEFILTTMSHFAQAESSSISGNMKRSIRMRLEMGTYTKSKAAYGYTLQDGHMAVNEAQAQVVRWIFNQYLNGMGIQRIALALSMKGVPRADGSPDWAPNTVSYILQNEGYIGDHLSHKFYSEDTVPFKRRRNHGEKDQFLLTGIQIPIIERDTYERVQARLHNKGRNLRNPKDNRPTYPFSQLVYCNACGSVYCRKVCGSKAYWICAKGSKAAGVCKGARIPEPLLDDMFIRLYNKLKNNHAKLIEPLLEKLHALKRRISLNNPCIAEYNERILQLSEQNSLLAGLVAKGIMDSTLAIPQINENERLMREFKQKSTQLTYNEKLDALIDSTKLLAQLVQEGPERIQEMDERLLRSIVTRITVEDKEQVTIVLTNGLELAERLDWSVIP